MSSHDLASLAATIERVNADHDYWFSATAAYCVIVLQRIKELRETPVSGIQTVGEFIERRLGPAMATVDATVKRLDSLSERLNRVSDLLRTRVNIMTEPQNQQRLENSPVARRCKSNGSKPSKAYRLQPSRITQFF